MNEGKDTSQLSVHAEPALLQIDFYHLRNADLATPLAMLAHKTVASGQSFLYLRRKTAMWLSVKDFGHSGQTAFWHMQQMRMRAHEHAQIWLTSDVAVNQIDARFLALTAGLEPPEVQKFDRVFNLFDGTSEVAVSAARDSWKRWSGTEDVIVGILRRMIRVAGARKNRLRK